MYLVCIEADECGWVSHQEEPTEEDQYACPECLSGVLLYTDNFWLNLISPVPHGPSEEVLGGPSEEDWNADPPGQNEPPDVTDWNTHRVRI